MGTKGFRVLIEEGVNDDGLAGVYTSNSTVSRKGLIDSEGVADMGCIKEFANVAGSRSKSNSCAKGHKLSPSMRVIQATEGSDRERGLGVDHPCCQTGELGLLHGPSAPSVGLGPVTRSAEFSQCPSQPAEDKVSTSQKPVSLSSSSVHISGPSKAIKGRPRLSVIPMGKFKIGVKKKRIRGFGMTIVGSGAPNGEDPFTSTTLTGFRLYLRSYKRRRFRKTLHHCSFFRWNNVRVIWRVVCAALLWSLWKGRNELLFNGTMSEPSYIFDRAQVCALEWLKARGNFSDCSLEEWVYNPLSLLHQSHSVLSPRRKFVANRKLKSGDAVRCRCGFG
ncbi:hypothetical protein Ancab_039364 [Ancistrocladus abbreviatus]